MNPFKKKTKTEKPPLDLMREGAEPIIIAPFNGVDVPVKVRCLNEVQIRSCGDFGIIDVEDKDESNDGKGKYNDKELSEIINHQEKLLQATLVNPTYEQIVDEVYGQDGWLNEAKKELEEVKALVESLGNDSKDMEQGFMYTRRINMMEMRLGYLLPMDFTATIVAWAIGADRGDIKKLTKKMLIRAAAAAKVGNKSPSDKLEGKFTAFQKTEIDLVANNLFNEEQEMHREMQKGKKAGSDYKFFGKKPKKVSK